MAVPDEVQEVTEGEPASEAPPTFIPSDELIDKYLLPRDKFARALVGAGLAGCWRLFNDLMRGNLKGKDLLDALRFIEKQFGLPKFTKEEIASIKGNSRWAKVLGKKMGFDIEDLLANIQEQPE